MATRSPRDEPASYAVNLDSLFDPTTRIRVAITFDPIRGRFVVGNTEEVVDDLLTAVSLYTFGLEPFQRVVVARPSSYGIDQLRRDRWRALALIREYPPRHQHLEFGVAPEATAAWTRLVRERQAWHRSMLLEHAGSQLVG